MAEISYYEDGYYEEPGGDTYYVTEEEAPFQAIGAPRRAGIKQAYLVHAAGGPSTDPVDFYWSHNHPSPSLAGASVPQYDPIVTSMGTLEQSLTDSSGIIGSRLRSTVGTLELDLSSALHDDITLKDWHDRIIEVYKGDATGPNAHNFLSYSRILNARTKDWRGTRTSMTLEINDLSLELADSPEKSRYAGTGIFEGDANLTDKVKPFNVGLSEFVSPVLVDAVAQIYQSHDGSVTSQNPGYVKGVFLNFAGDISTLGLTDLYAWTPVPGSYISDNARGLIRLGAPPGGRFTLRVQNLGVSPLPFISPAASMFTLLSTFKPSVPRSLTSFITLNNQVPGNVGLYIPTGDSRSLGALLDELARTANAWWGFTREGVLKVERLPILTESIDYVITEGDIVGDSLTREATLSPIWKWDIGWGNIETVHTEEEIENAAITPESRRTQLQHKNQRLKFETPSILSNYPSARTVTFDSLFIAEQFAQGLLDRLLQVHGVERHTYRLRVKKRTDEFQPGKLALLDINRLNLPRTTMVRTVIDRWDSNETDLLLWG